MSAWFPMPRYQDLTLAARLGCGHIVFATLRGAWPQEWAGPLYCWLCDSPSSIWEWWHVWP